jgi:M6 family metalloprotease-like protein
MRLLLGLLLLAQDEAFDPAKYQGPSEAKSVELKPPAQGSRAYLGLGTPASFEEGGIVLGDVVPDGPAAKAGLRGGDRLVKVAGRAVPDFNALSRLVRSHKPGERIEVVLEREGEERSVEVTLGAAPAGADAPGGLTMWTKPGFTLGVVRIEFPDEKHNPAFATKDWEQLLFSRGAYTEKSPTGERVYGSVADYYHEVSYGAFALRGKVFDWVELDRPRSWFEPRKMQDKEGAKEFLPKALSRVRERDGEGCFDGVDGIVFLHAGRQTYNRPYLLWPHRASISAGKRSVPYYLVAEGGARFNAINVHVHEFGHMLGLPDQYGQKHQTGVGKWCTMAVGHMGSGESRTARPHHLCVECKERLGWVKATAIDPKEPQWLKLGAIETDGTQAFKLRVGEETYFLENRERAGFDAEIEGTGLLIWRETRQGLDLVESHGRKVPNASLVETEEIPYPSFYNRHFTPATTPAAPAGLFVTDVAKRDGVVYFKVGVPNSAKSNAIEKRRDY